MAMVQDFWQQCQRLVHQQKQSLAQILMSKTSLKDLLLISILEQLSKQADSELHMLTEQTNASMLICHQIHHTQSQKTTQSMFKVQKTSKSQALAKSSRQAKHFMAFLVLQTHGSNHIHQALTAKSAKQ